MNVKTSWMTTDGRRSPMHLERLEKWGDCLQRKRVLKYRIVLFSTRLPEPVRNTLTNGHRRNGQLEGKTRESKGYI